MPRRSRPFAIVALVLLWTSHARADDSADRIDRALHAAETYLLDHQSADGAWRSRRYGFLKDGPSLTPHVAWAVRSLAASDHDDATAASAVSRATVYLQALVTVDDRLRDGVDLVYPTYTAAGALRLVSATPSGRDAWAKILRGQQLTESLGWQSADLEFGGWSYAIAPPHRPPVGQSRGPWDWSNLSATVDALDALHASGVDTSDTTYGNALVHVRRCQNLANDGSVADPRFDDGGFVFTPAEAIRNKAGPAGVDGTGRQRFRSYGSATADGIWALSVCGVSPQDRRVIAAQRWLTDHFSADHVPGDFIPQNEDIRDATYFYYCRSASHVMSDHTSQRTFAEAILRRQRPDGSWTNACTDAREDDPLVATPLAIEALLNCREIISARPPAP